jgi:hypothetical protein
MNMICSVTIKQFTYSLFLFSIQALIFVPFESHREMKNSMCSYRITAINTVPSTSHMMPIHCTETIWQCHLQHPNLLLSLDVTELSRMLKTFWHFADRNCWCWLKNQITFIVCLTNNVVCTFRAFDVCWL